MDLNPGGCQKLLNRKPKGISGKDGKRFGSVM